MNNNSYNPYENMLQVLEHMRKCLVLRRTIIFR